MPEERASPALRNEQQEGVQTGGNLPAPGVVRVVEASRNKEFIDSVNIGPREICSIEQAIAILCLSRFDACSHQERTSRIDKFNRKHD